MTNIGNTNEIIKEPNLIYKYLDQLNFIEDKSGINGRYIVIAIFSCFIIVFIGVLESAITNLVGIFIQKSDFCNRAVSIYIVITK